MSKQPSFYSADGTDIRVALDDGRVALVGGTPRGLPAAFNRAAVRAGCLTTDMPSSIRMQGPAVPVENDAVARRQMIKDRMREALNTEEGAPGFDEAFTTNGLPNINWLSQQVGFTVDRSERDELWNEVQNEEPTENDDENGDDADRGDNVDAGTSGMDVD